MPIYRNIVVDIPSKCYIEKKDQSVFVKDRNEYDPAVKYNRVSHVIIGRAIDKTRMYPNHNFRMRYPEAFQQAAGEPQLKSIKRMGMYAVVLALLEKNSMYRCLHETMGIESANLILDFCMYSILHHSAVSDHFRTAMSEQLLFSRNLKSGKDLSSFFNQDENIERLERFKTEWAGACKKRGIKNVWLAIDGSNNDCAADADIAERGYAKSKKDVPVVSYLYAVDSSDGTPISFDVYRGSRVDSKAVMKMIGWLKAYEMNVKGVVVDRGFATKDVLEMLDSNELQYVAMLKGDTNAHKTMLAGYASKISRQFEFMLDRYDNSGKTDNVSVFNSNDNVYYGISSEDKVKLFTQHKYKAYVSLIFDGQNGEERQQNWFKKVSNAAVDLQNRLNSGEDAKVPKEFEKSMEIQQNEGRKTVLINMEKVQICGDQKGFSSLATSEKMSAGRANEIYTMRSSVEADFAIVKTQLCYGKTGVHSETGIKTKISIGFIASVIRNELLKAAKKAGLPTNKIAKEINYITMGLNQSDRYFVSHTESKKQKEFLKECGVLPADLDRIAEAENKRISSKEPNPFHKFPKANTKEKKSKSGQSKADNSSVSGTSSVTVGKEE